MRRRDLLAAGAALLGARAAGLQPPGGPMYGLIGKMTAVDGKRDALIAILLEGAAALPGCLSYVVAQDARDPNAVWITEVWKDEASHAASLNLSSVRDAIAKGRPLIAAIGERFETIPVGGQGLG
ncbi:MAG TPA: putative quinol monooxygenase [Vicinamibacterales bacterium]|nr:putative quinol monooxygenase [Vicinamibacterales bacterium]